MNKSVTLRGLGTDATIVQAHEEPDEAPERVFFVEEVFTGMLERNTIRHGKSIEDERGGGIRSGRGTLTLINSTVSNNTTPGEGGGIYVKGTLDLVNTIIANNTAGGESGDCTIADMDESGI